MILYRGSHYEAAREGQVSVSEGTGGWILTATTVRVLQQSEVLVLQALRQNKGRDAEIEIEIVEIRWSV